MKNGVYAAETAEIAQQTESTEICELLVAELEGRRERLRHLLRMVLLEAQRHSPVQPAGRMRQKCKRAAARPV
jgi:hypothetical protein